MIWYSVAEMPNAVKRPMHSDSWGSWTYDEEMLTLNYRTRAGWDYHVDLAKITNCDQLIEWIFHISQKRDYDMENFVKALGDLLNPRGTLFRSGNFNPTAWLRRPRTGDDVSVEVYRRIWEQFREQHRERPEATQKKENKSSKTLKIALNLVCPIGTVGKTHAAMKEQLEDAYGIRLNEVPKATVHRVRKELNIETTGGIDPTWSRPTDALKGELCLDAN